MARPLRIEFSGALYHVSSRGDRREAIYEDDEDRLAFLRLLAEVVDRYNWLCHAYGKMRVRGDELSIPKRQRRAPAPSLARITEANPDRNDAIIAAYGTGAYSYREIAACYGLHLATIGRIGRRHWMQQCEN